MKRYLVTEEFIDWNDVDLGADGMEQYVAEIPADAELLTRAEVLELAYLSDRDTERFHERLDALFGPATPVKEGGE